MEKEETREVVENTLESIVENEPAVENTLEEVKNTLEPKEEVVETPRKPTVETPRDEFINLDKLDFGLDNINLF